MAKAKRKKKPVTKNKPTPVVLSINICDAVIRDETTKKVSLIGLFSAITASSFPAVHPLMHVYVALTNGHGKYKTEIRFTNLDENKPLIGMEGPLNFKNPLQVVEINLAWRDLRFEKSGDYEVEVLCDNERIGSRKFRIIGPNDNIHPTHGTGVK